MARSCSITGSVTVAETAIHTIDKEVPVRIHPMSYYVEQGLRQREFLTLLLSIFAALAVLLAALGIFGVVVKGLFYLLIIGVVVLIADIVLAGVRLRRSGRRPGR